VNQNKKITIMNNDQVYQKVTDQILTIIDEKKEIPWSKPWKSLSGGIVPCNYDSKKPYKGINLIMTVFDKFSSPFYLTANQIKKRGGSWKGKGTVIVFWKQINITEKNKEGETVKKRIPLLKYFHVWNEEQISGIDFKHPEPAELNEFGEIKEVEDILTKMPSKPKIDHIEQNRACYIPSRDQILMPVKGQFETLEDYYHTFAHELIHSTCHKERLNRELKMDRESYSKEELVAEMGASFIMGLAGIEHKMEQSADYIKS